MKPKTELEPEDLVYELADLEGLIETIRNLLAEEGNFVRANGSRDTALDRISCLINIALSHTAALAAGVAHFEVSGMYVRMKGGK